MLNQNTADTIYRKMKNKPEIKVWKRFCAKIELAKKSQCWEWQGTKSHGYGQFFLQGSQKTAHIVIVKWFVGSIPNGLVVDHFECNNRSCVNPAHLKVVSRGDNVVRSNSATGLNSRKEFCKYGHPLTDDNVYIDGKGRRCRACKTKYNSEYGKKRKRKNGKREPVKLSESVEALLKDNRFAPTRITMKNPPSDATWARFLGFIDIEQESGCWLFNSSKIDGYGQFSLGSKTGKPHRLMKTWIDGSIPKGCDVDHICGRRHCVSPKHLRSVTPKQNILAGPNTLAGRNANKTHCPQGHPFEGSNVMKVDGKRVCRKCHNERSRKYPAEKKRNYALKHYYKNMENPAFREKMRLKSAENRKKMRELKKQNGDLEKSL